jgi:MFS family permease
MISRNAKIVRILLMISVAIVTFLIVYTPHYGYPFPRHVDEWHHITEAIKLQKGGYAGGVIGYRIGFQILLLLFSKIADLVLIYQFLPAIWAAFSGLVLFHVVYKKTDNQFYVALFAMIFFASIKSNVNITGLWFFTPLSFSIPFIFLYVYFFTEGIEKQNKRLILSSLGIMLILLFIHSISVLFAISFLVIYSLFNLKYLREEWKFFSTFLAVPLTGIIFYKFMTKVPWGSLAKKLIEALQFRRGWGVLELENSFFELYSLIGYILAVIGLILICRNGKNLKKYLAYGVWPLTVLISIMIYRKTGVSYLSPYQRNLYYFAISLPMLSAFGLDYLCKEINKIILIQKKELHQKASRVMLLFIIIFFTFKSYWYIPKQIDLYKVIDNNEYQALLFLSSFPEKTVVMATPRISTALYPISGHNPVATYFFYGNRKDSEMFFQTDNCKVKQSILDRYDAKYVLSEYPINCNWKLIYNEGVYIYEID